MTKKPVKFYELWLNDELKGTYDSENEAEEALHELLSDGKPGSSCKIKPVETVVKKRKEKR
jgi:hypothetical protein